LLAPEDGGDQARPLQLSVGAVFANGRFAHIDATMAEPPVLDFSLSADGTYVDVQRHQLAFRMTAPEYRPLMDTDKMLMPLARLDVVGSRVDAHCHPTHVLVLANSLIANSFFVRYGGGALERDSVHAFPENIDMTLTYGTLAVRFCMFRLPLDPMVGRPADDRVGYFDIPFVAIGDFRNEQWPDRGADELLNPKIRLIQRQRLRSGSTGQHELLVYVDHTVPVSFREATKKGVLKWRAAFQEIGLGDVVRAVAPGDDGFPHDYDVADVRFNTISWAAGDGLGAFAIGQSVSDPRSGEILKANIVVTLGWLQAWLGEALLLHAGLPLDSAMTPQSGRHLLALGGAAAADPAPGIGSADGEVRVRASNWSLLESGAGCPRGGRALRQRHPHEDLVCRALLDDSPALWLAAKSRSKAEVQAFLEQGIADVTAHEFGHTLGLRHNFQGSVQPSFKEAQDPAYVERHGFSASVMDYLATNIISQKETSQKEASSSADQGGQQQQQHYAFTPVIGAYDKWAIKYGYSQIQGEHCCVQSAELAAIAAEYQKADFSFATDEDADISGDPFTVRHDLTAEPVKWHLDRLQIVEEGQAELAARALQGHERLTRLAQLELRLLWAGARACADLARFVGGVRVFRKHVEPCEDECPAGSKPLEPVQLNTQLEALEGILQALKAGPGERIWPGTELQRLLVTRWGTLGLRPVELTAALGNLKASLLQWLLEPARLTRISMSGELLEEPALVRRVLQRISQVLLGADVGQNMDFQKVASAVTQPLSWHVQREYVERLKTLASPALSWWAPVVDHQITATVQAERIRLAALVRTAFEKLHVKDDETAEQAGFLRTLLFLLSPRATKQSVS